MTDKLKPSQAIGENSPVLYYDSAAPRNRIVDELREVYRYRDLVGNLVRRNVTSRYKRSFLGILWTLLDPLFTMIVMAIVFGALFETAMPRFTLFLLSGIVIWNFISQSSTQAIGDLMYGGGLINQVYMPRSVYAFAAIGTGLANLGFAMIPLVILIVLTGAPITWAWLFLPLSVLIVSVFTLGFGLMMSAFSVYFADVLNIHNILLQLLMWMSGIFYTLETLPERIRVIIGLIPTFNMITLFRAPLYAGELPPLGTILYASVVGIIFLIVGLKIFIKLSDAIAYRV